MTWEEFTAQQKLTEHGRYQQINVECPKCGHFIFKDCQMTLTCYPPQYRYVCLNPECKWTGTY